MNRHKRLNLRSIRQMFGNIVTIAHFCRGLLELIELICFCESMWRQLHKKKQDRITIGGVIYHASLAWTARDCNLLTSFTYDIRSHGTTAMRPSCREQSNQLSVLIRRYMFLRSTSEWVKLLNSAPAIVECLLHILYQHCRMISFCSHRGKNNLTHQWKRKAKLHPSDNTFLHLFFLPANCRTCHYAYGRFCIGSSRLIFLWSIPVFI